MSRVSSRTRAAETSRVKRGAPAIAPAEDTTSDTENAPLGQQRNRPPPFVHSFTSSVSSSSSSSASAGTAGGGFPSLAGAGDGTADEEEEEDPSVLLPPPGAVDGITASPERRGAATVAAPVHATTETISPPMLSRALTLAAGLGVPTLPLIAPGTRLHLPLSAASATVLAGDPAVRAQLRAVRVTLTRTRPSAGRGAAAAGAAIVAASTCGVRVTVERRWCCVSVPLTFPYSRAAASHAAAAAAAAAADATAGAASALPAAPWRPESPAVYAPAPTGTGGVTGTPQVYARACLCPQDTGAAEAAASAGNGELVSQARREVAAAVAAAAAAAVRVAVAAPVSSTEAAATPAAAAQARAAEAHRLLGDSTDGSSSSSSSGSGDSSGDSGAGPGAGANDINPSAERPSSDDDDDGNENNGSDDSAPKRTAAPAATNDSSFIADSAVFQALAPPPSDAELRRRIRFNTVTLGTAVHAATNADGEAETAAEPESDEATTADACPGTGGIASELAHARARVQVCEAAVAAAARNKKKGAAQLRRTAELDAAEAAAALKRLEARALGAPAPVIPSSTAATAVASTQPTLQPKLLLCAAPTQLLLPSPPLLPAPVPAPLSSAPAHAAAAAAEAAHRGCWCAATDDTDTAAGAGAGDSTAAGAVVGAALLYQHRHWHRCRWPAVAAEDAGVSRLGDVAARFGEDVARLQWFCMYYKNGARVAGPPALGSALASAPGLTAPAAAAAAAARTAAAAARLERARRRAVAWLVAAARWELSVLRRTGAPVPEWGPEEEERLVVRTREKGV